MVIWSGSQIRTNDPNQRSVTLLRYTRPTTNPAFRPHLDNGAERTRYMAQQATGIFGLSFERFDITHLNHVISRLLSIPALYEVRRVSA